MLRSRSRRWLLVLSGLGLLWAGWTAYGLLHPNRPDIRVGMTEQEVERLAGGGCLASIISSSREYAVWWLPGSRLHVVFGRGRVEEVRWEGAPLSEYVDLRFRILLYRLRQAF